MFKHDPNGDEDSAEGNSDIDSNTLKVTALNRSPGIDMHLLVT